VSDARYSRSARMLDDPNLGGDLLLVGLAFARFLDFGGIPPGQRLSTNHVADCVWPALSHRAWKVKRVLADDARCYQPPLRYKEDGRRCGAPMIRRDGPCGRTATWSKLLTDWTTGEKSWLMACSRHVQWYDEIARANRESKPDVVPLPAANHGGVLARHIPEFGWPKIWAWATDGRWVEHPEVEPWRPPTLTLHLGDGDAADLSDRPALGLVTS
jgi:hypothetical protein